MSEKVENVETLNVVRYEWRSILGPKGWEHCATAITKPDDHPQYEIRELVTLDQAEKYAENKWDAGYLAGRLEEIGNQKNGDDIRAEVLAKAVEKIIELEKEIEILKITKRD